VADITYIRLCRDFVYLAVLMDVFTRSIRGWHLSRNLDQGLTLAALERALVVAIPTIHHSDQGLQYAATAYVERLKKLGVQLSRLISLIMGVALLLAGSLATYDSLAASRSLGTVPWLSILAPAAELKHVGPSPKRTLDRSCDRHAVGRSWFSVCRRHALSS
jgi:hypothetical protein